jgi:GT2 family glycosyltransferase
LSLIEVSIVICTYNRSARLAKALAALSSVQSQRRWEAIIVDNNSDDETPNTVKRWIGKIPNLRYVFEARRGLGAARDRGWREAQGALIALTDDDCYVAPDYVDAIAQAFEEYPDVGCIGGRILLHDPTDAKVTIDTRDYSVEYRPFRFFAPGDMHGANLTFRRAALEAIGGIDPALGAGSKFQGAEDTDAVAAVLWAGYSARYDPRPTVSHHHGRKQADIPALLANYDMARGAYYAKYMLRRRTRFAYVRGWIAKNWQDGTRIQLDREMDAAYLYLEKSNKFAVFVGLVPLRAVLTLSLIAKWFYLRVMWRLEALDKRKA